MFLCDRTGGNTRLLQSLAGIRDMSIGLSLYVGEQGYCAMYMQLLQIKLLLRL